MAFRKSFLVVALVALIISGILFYEYFKKQDKNEIIPPPQINYAVNGESPKPSELFAENLHVPWEIAFLPSGGMLFTERSGTLVRIENGKKTEYTIGDVAEDEEGGLLGLALHPDFTDNHFIYVYYGSKGNAYNRNNVVRFTMDGNQLSDKKIILDDIPGSNHHAGGRIAFGPDGLLYIAVGDSGESRFAQNLDSLAGKILRIRDDGSIPEDNPFGNAVYSYGHRNPQGLAWDDSGRLWSAEHGPSGVPCCHDEINLIEKGKNYGWPDIIGDESDKNMVTPVLQSGDDTWAPSGLAYWNGRLFFAGLAGEALYGVKINDDGTLTLSTYFKRKYGRLRAVAVGPDGFLYVSTSNLDGRGTPRKEDDRILRIDPKTLEP